jgi:hypothetical protein
MRLIEREAWDDFRMLFTTSHEWLKPKLEMIVKDMLDKFQNLMSFKVNFLHCHLNYFQQWTRRKFWHNIKKIGRDVIDVGMPTSEKITIDHWK